ncbi:MAG: AI-2E family transporter [Chloroflexi bacterium]|nr:AI-2E family transporter [Chloroflexota bacterium]
MTSDNEIQNGGIEKPLEEHVPLNQPVARIEVDVNRLKLPTVIMATAGILGVLVISFLLYRTLTLLLLLFLSLLIATAIEPLVNWLRRGPLNRSAGILVVYTGIFLVIAAIGLLTVPLAISQVGQIGTSLNQTVGEMKQSVNEIDKGQPNSFLRQQASAFVDAASTALGQFGPAATPTATPPATPQSNQQKVESVTTTALTIAEAFFSVITIFVVAFYWLTERTLIKRAAISWLPPKRANRVRRVWDDIEVKVGGWVRGQLTLMLIVGLISAVGYLVIGVKYWPALALFIAVAEAIPLVGPYIGTAPAVLVALTQGVNEKGLFGVGGGIGLALIVVVFAILLQMVEGNVLIPRVMKNSVGISPLTVIVSILLGATLAGIVGALVAVPIAGSLQVIISDIKAAHESEEKFEAQTEAAQETRESAGELVVAVQGVGETKTRVESQAKAEG